MEKQNILLNLRGHYGADSFFGSEIELITEGTLTMRDGKYILEYDEASGSGGKPVRIRVTADGEDVRLQCDDESCTDFIFSERQCFLTAYETPDGLVEITILPGVVKSRLGPDKGVINLEYSIRMGGLSAYNKLSIDYKLKN